MKVNRLEAHDRYKHFTNQSFDIGECCQDLINQRPFGDYPFYIFAHARTNEDGVTKRLIWQPRLTRPKPQTNSMLFKGYPGSDLVKMIWIIPERSLWKNFHKDQMTFSSIVEESIYNFEFNREKLEKKEDDDLDDATIDQIYKEISLNAKPLQKRIDELLKEQPLEKSTAEIV